MSDRPGHIVEEIDVGLPDRDNPIARIATPRASEIVAHLFRSLHIDTRKDD
jgi:NitT/TauT family transport system ATP-binding protein